MALSTEAYVTGVGQSEVGMRLTRSPMGLTKDWAYQIIKLVGNYAETYDRNVGPSTPIGLERGLNALWRDGGIQYAPPIR